MILRASVYCNACISGHHGMDIFNGFVLTHRGVKKMSPIPSLIGPSSSKVFHLQMVQQVSTLT